jgi:hypothetical protein
MGPGKDGMRALPDGALRYLAHIGLHQRVIRTSFQFGKSDHDFLQFLTASRTVLNCNGRLRRLARSASRLASRAMDCFMPELRPLRPEIPCLCDPMPPRPCCMSRLKAQRPPDHLIRSINECV